MNIFFGKPFFIIASLFFFTACSERENKVPSLPAPEVIVSKPLQKMIVDWDEYVGRFEAIERVDIRSRVSGSLEDIQFDDGEFVKKGDILFVVDQRPYKIAVDRAQAQYQLAKKEYDRAVNLRKQRAIAQEELDRRAQEQIVALTTLEDARLNLEFTEVKSPIDGKVSRAFIDVGNLITGGSATATLLTTVVSTDPIHFYFDASEGELLRYVRLDRSGSRPGSDSNPNPIKIRLQDESEYLHEGQMDFVDNAIDTSTGTIEGRALVPNPDAIMYPGLFGRARLLGSGEYQALLLPDTAIGTDQSRKYVLVVNQENIVERRFIEPGGLHDDRLRIIRSGLAADDTVIINGLQRARPGATVAPTEQAAVVNSAAES